MLGRATGPENLVIASVLNATPWFWPGLAIAIAIGLVAAGKVGAALRCSRVLAFALVLSLGGIAVLTLTPHDPGFVGGPGITCDLHLAGPLGLAQLLGQNLRSLNVDLFVPLGISIGLLHWPRVKLPAAVGGAILPFAVEAVQAGIPALGRSCTATDVMDNLLGLAIGLAVGLVAVVATAGARRLAR